MFIAFGKVIIGMFDSIYVNCPNCESSIEMQIKVGFCTLQSYNIHNAPLSLLAGVVDNIEKCNECNTMFRIALVHKPVVEAQKLTQEEIEDLND